MAGTVPFPAHVAATVRERTAVAAVPWYIWCSVIAVSSAIIGAHWDISWHRSIGRDTFWTPAHIAIYMCGVLAGISCGYLILHTTFAGSSEARANSVSMWGFRAPLGAFIAAWGGLAMITSAPFDDWWHSAYGLDVKILSPPHVLLIAGVLTVQLGSLILALGAMNRATGELRSVLERVFLYIGAMIVLLLLILTMEYIFRIYMHSGRFYRVIGVTIPIALAALARASRHKWATTIVTGIYTAFILGLLWILPLFPAEPKLGPVYQQVTHFVPPEFPLLLIVPAILLDLLRTRIEPWRKWAQAALLGVVFMVSFLAVQWPFANFLLSPGARNPVFGAIYFDYGMHPQSYYFRHLFLPLEPAAARFRAEMALAFAASIVMTRLGLAMGDWMRRIRR